MTLFLASDAQRRNRSFEKPHSSDGDVVSTTCVGRSECECPSGAGRLSTLPAQADSDAPWDSGDCRALPSCGSSGCARTGTGSAARRQSSWRCARCTTRASPALPSVCSSSCRAVTRLDRGVCGRSRATTAQRPLTSESATADTTVWLTRVSWDALVLDPVLVEHPHELQHATGAVGRDQHAPAPTHSLEDLDHDLSHTSATHTHLSSALRRLPSYSLVPPTASTTWTQDALCCRGP